MKRIRQINICKIVLIFTFVLSTLYFVSSVNANESSTMFRGIRPLGMGGAFIALADDQNAFFYNPAGLALREKGMLTMFELPITLSKDIYALYDYYNENKDAIENFDQESNDTQQKIMNDIIDRITLYRIHLTLGMPNMNFVTGPVKFANGDKMHLGVGLFDLVDVKMKVNAGILVPTLDLWGSADMIGIVPVVYKWQTAPLSLPGSISLGANIKYIMRGRFEETRRSILELEDYDPSYQRGTGIGLDVGMLYEINQQWNAGMMISDFGGTNIKFEEATSAGIKKEPFTGVIKSKVNVGFAFKPNKIHYWAGKYLNIGNKHLTLAFDLNNITDPDEKLFAETFFMKVHMGAELKWKMIAFRGGFNQGYPCFGAGLDLLFLNLDYAFYVDELSEFAGMDPEVNHMFNVALRF